MQELGMKILVACEESQAVTIELRKLGHEAYSCDIQECSGGHPEWHILGDVVPELKKHWDMIIAFPPCTDLAVSGAAWFEQKRKDGRQQASIDFFMLFANADCERIAIENPVGIMSTHWRKPDQKIQPYWFGDEAQKTTCLWLKGLPKLEPTNIVGKGEKIKNKRKDGRIEYRAAWFMNSGETWRMSSEQRRKIRSKTFQGIAKAMAEQWAGNA